MPTDDLVFYDIETPIDELIVQVHENELALAPSEVDVVDAARAIDGEVWSPQLPPYRAWAAQGGEKGADGDLLVVGSLGMGLSDEEREALLAQATSGSGEGTRLVRRTRGWRPSTCAGRCACVATRTVTPSSR